MYERGLVNDVDKIHDDNGDSEVETIMHVEVTKMVVNKR